MMQKKLTTKMNYKIGLLVSLLFVLSLFVGCKKSERELVIYTSVDRVYSEQIFNEFTKETGITVLPVYDVEATKTTGLAQRIIAEKEHPVADIFWNGEMMYTIELAKQETLQPYLPKVIEGRSNRTSSHLIGKDNLWVGFGGRARVFIINKDKVTEDQYPMTMHDLINASETYAVGMAKPLSGTTATHTAALYSVMGQEQARALFEAIEKSKMKIVDGNGAVRDMVVSGELDFGITDTDDALGAVEKGANVALVFPDQGDGQPGTLVIPNSVGIIKNAKHVEDAKLFVEYLLKEETQQKLIDIGWSQLSQEETLLISEGLKAFLPKNGILKTIDADFETISEMLLISKSDMTTLFLK